LNRRSLRDAMLARTGTAARASQCFILLDIDHFKAINDRLGHGAGDAVLVEVARRLGAAVGTRGKTLRWGGEEFLVYAEGGSVQHDARLVRDLLDAIVATPFRAADGALLPVTITAGALTLAPDAASLDWEQALALADQALYLGKQNGRNRAYLAEAGRAGPTQLRLTLIEPDGAPQPVAERERQAA
jgi:diguanylate cyclase (GGDEF)-like protein